MPTTLHPQLQADCYPLGRVDSSTLLLHKNALIPWFILIPDTDKNELYKLASAQQQRVHEEVNSIAQFVEEYFQTDKLNIASIGNMVPQLHIHIIGRFKDDFCWPKPVWGQSEFAQYNDQKLRLIKQALLDQKLIHV